MSSEMWYKSSRKYVKGVDADMEKEKEVKITASEALKMLRDAWNLGVELGQDNSMARIAQRIVISNRVKALRTEKGMSQEKFSEIIRVPFLTYKGYENRKSDIPTHTLVRIANELGTSLDYLTGRTDVAKTESLEERISRLEELVNERKQ